MNDDVQNARDDLAFVRALVSESAPVQAVTGKAMLFAGLCYGVQCLAQGGILWSGWNAPDAVNLIAGALPTVIFIIGMIWLTWLGRNFIPSGVGTRALSAAFGGAGLAALSTTIIFGWVAWREQNMMIWLFHPIMVGVVQGVVWYIAFAIRRRGWLGLVSIGWFATAILLAFLNRTPAWFVIVIGIALFALMALPGWVLLKTAKG